jgi:hypothetical protein
MSILLDRTDDVSPSPIQSTVARFISSASSSSDVRYIVIGTQCNNHEIRTSSKYSRNDIAII